MAEILPYFFYAVIGVAIIMYAVLDGFDLGVGCLHLFAARTDNDRRIMLNAIGPVWDGNEVWLVIVMGGLFAGFTDAFATIFSAFYNIFIFLIAALIFRAVAIEMRSKQPMLWWRRFWDGAFAVGSVGIAFLLGLVLGNLALGIPLNAQHDYLGTFGDFFSAYSVLIGVLVVSLMSLHGCIYLILKTEGALQQRLRAMMGPMIITFLGLLFLATTATLLYVPQMAARFVERPWLLGVIALGMAAIGVLLWMVRRHREGWAFISSCTAITCFIALFGIGTFPDLVHSTVDPAVNSVTILSAASSTYTLKILAIIVIIGVPMVLGYMGWVYKVFRGKVRIDHSSY